MKEHNDDILSPHLLKENQAAYGVPKVCITLEALQKMKCFTDEFPHEINGFGTVVKKENVLTIMDVFILPQVSGANHLHVATDSNSFNQLIYKLVKKGKDPSLIALQWHSHSSASVFFSLEDISTIRKYLNCDFMISIVINKKGDILSRLDIFRPIQISLEVPLMVIIPDVHPKVRDVCRNAIEKCVRLDSETSYQGNKKRKMNTGKPNQCKVATHFLLDKGNKRERHGLSETN